VTGKGGTGRSAVTAALARAAASRGADVLALALGEPGGLADHLGVAALGPEPCGAGPGVSAAAVEPVAALAEYLRLRFGPGPVRTAARVFGAVAQAVPGVRDIVVIGKAVHEARRGGWDHVIVDGYPTGQIESVLAAPGAIAEVAGRGAIREQAAGLLDVLRDPESTSFVVVTAPAELALTEAVEFESVADRLEMTRARSLVVNWVVPDPGFAAPPEQSGPQREAAEFCLGVVARQQHLLASHSPDRLLPWLFGAGPPTAVATALAEELR
jgi:anion-transporting  ArsA/GET3 family ATPase